MITWPVIIQHKTQGAFSNIFNSVKQFFTSEHPYNRTVIEIWHYKWFVNDHMTFVVKNLFKTLKNVQLPAYMHTSEICSVKFNLLSILTPSTFILSVEDIVVFSTFIIKPSTPQPWDEFNIVWNFSGLTFKEFCLNQFIETIMSFVKNFRMSSIVSLGYGMQLSSP